MKVRTILAVAVLLLSSCAWAGDILAGDAQRVWLVRPAADNKSDVFVKELGVSWRVSVRNQTSVPTAAVANGDMLHLFYPERQHAVIDPFGGMQVMGNLPGELLAACTGDDIGGAEKDKPAVFVLVHRNEPPTLPSPDTQPTTAEAQSPPARPQGPCECLYRATGNEWTLVAWQPVSEKQDSVSPVFLAVLKGKMYRLRREGNAQNSPFALRVLSVGPEGLANWTDVQTITAGQLPLSMIALKDRLILILADATTTATSAPAERTLSIARYSPAAKSPMTYQPISQNQAVAHWPAEHMPSVSRLGEQLAVLWQDDKTTYFALCSTSGAIDPAENVTKTLESMPDIEWASNLYNYFLMGIVIVVGVGMFYRRWRTPPKPFILATGLTPGNLLKRLLAALIDFLPFYFVAGGIFLPADLGLDSVQHFVENPSTVPPVVLVAMIYTMMLSQGLYIVYGTIMEIRFGATLGKKLMRLRAVKEDGSRLGLREAAVRNATKIIELSMLMSTMAWLMMIFVLLPLLTRNRQRLGDMIARTAVVEASSLEAMQAKKANTPDSPPTSHDKESM